MESQFPQKDPGQLIQLQKPDLSVAIARTCLIVRYAGYLGETFWVDGSSKSTAEAGYLSAVSEIRRDFHTAEEALRRLSMAKEEWLLVLDNADDIQINYHDFLPAGQRGLVIITSRNPDCRHHQTIGYVHLEGINNHNRSQLLLSAADIEKDQCDNEVQSAEAISQMLCGHPLAILQASAYIKQFCSVADYTEIFRSRPQQQMAFGFVQGCSRFAHVQGTFDVSVNALDRIGDQTARGAKDLLRLLSTLYFSNLPLETFRAASEGFESASPEATFLGGIMPVMSAATPIIFGAQQPFWSNENLQNAISTLRSLALVDVSTRRGLKSLSMHHLVHS